MHEVRDTGVIVAGGTATVQEQEVGDSIFQLIIDQLEELVVTLIEEVRERPGVAVAIAAGVLGAVIGSVLARRSAGRDSPVPQRAVRSARRVGDAADLLGIGMRLMQNPIVRGLVLAALERQLRSRLPI
jgi:AcrR family transcriptional regulator